MKISGNSTSSVEASDHDYFWKIRQKFFRIFVLIFEFLSSQKTKPKFIRKILDFFVQFSFVNNQLKLTSLVVLSVGLIF